MLRPQHFSQQIQSGRFLLAIIGRQKSNFNCRLKLERNNLILKICCKNIVKKEQYTKNFTTFFTIIELTNFY